MAGWRRAIGAKARKRDPFGRLFLLTAPLILGLVALAMVLGPERSGAAPTAAPGGATSTFFALIDTIAATVLIGTACSAIMRWRLTREGASLQTGLALFALTFLWLVPTRVIAAGFDHDESGYTVYAVLGLAATAGLLVGGVGVARPRLFRAAVAPRWLWLGGSVVVIASVIMADWLSVSATTTIELEARVAVVVFAATASLYLLVGHRERRWLQGWVGLGLMSLCYAELLVAYSGGRMSFLVVASLLRLTAACVMLNGVARELVDAYVAQQQRLFGAVLNLQADEIGKIAAQSREAEIRHDLRSGLIAIQAAMSAFSRTRADTEFLSGTTLTDAVSAEIKRLWVLTDRTSERQEPVVYDLAEVVAPALACHRSLIDLDARVPAGLRLKGQPDAVVGAIVNLLTNARTHAAGASVELTATRVGPFVEVEVSDDGPGVADEVRPRLFDRGFTTRRDGTGLGLDIALQLTRSQGGDLFCDGPEVGARFRMVLPAAPDPNEEPTIDLTEPSEAPR
mgnify:FL=1